MAAHLARREPGRIVLKDEIERLMEGIIVIPEEEVPKEEGSSYCKEIKIVSSYPLGWTKIKRY